jgi:hypothetical protein
MFAFDPSLVEVLQYKKVFSNRTISCPQISTLSLRPLGMISLQFSQQDIIDHESAVETIPEHCTFGDPKMSSVAATIASGYSTYDIIPNPYAVIGLGACLSSSKDDNDTEDCGAHIDLRLKSNMVQRQTSRRGTDWVQILTDESAIAGGVVFFTWFLSIYII